MQGKVAFNTLGTRGFRTWKVSGTQVGLVEFLSFVYLQQQFFNLKTIYYYVTHNQPSC